MRLDMNVRKSSSTARVDSPPLEHPGYVDSYNPVAR